MSLGGYLAARAVAFEHRFRAAVFFDGVYDSYKALRRTLPKDAVAAYDSGDTARFEELVYKRMQGNTGLCWVVEHGIWSFGVPDLTAFVEAYKEYTVRGIAGQIKCPCLVMEAEADIFFQGQPQEVFDALQCPKQLVRFTAEDGAENHCQSGALSYKDEVVFNWLDETLEHSKPKA